MRREIPPTIKSFMYTGGALEFPEVIHVDFFISD